MSLFSLASCHIFETGLDVIVCVIPEYFERVLMYNIKGTLPDYNEIVFSFQVDSFDIALLNLCSTLYCTYFGFAV